MTREEAKKIMENEVRCVRNPNCERLECRNCYLVMPEHTVLKAYDVAIKALEQEPVLDKIRAELHATAEMHEDGDYYLREEWIDEIIDRYKAEVEPQESEEQT